MAKSLKPKKASGPDKIGNEMFKTGIKWYRKIPKISLGACIFQRPVLKGLIFGGAYVRREICVSKSIGLACSGKEIYRFCCVLLCIWGQIPSTSPQGGLYSEGRCNGGFFALRVWGAYTRRGLFSEFYGNPILKSGNKRDPANYRGICINS